MNINHMTIWRKSIG